MIGNIKETFPPKNGMQIQGMSTLLKYAAYCMQWHKSTSQQLNYNVDSNTKSSNFIKI